METAREFIYLGDRVCACGGSDTAVRFTTRFGWLSLGNFACTVWTEIASKAEKDCLQELCKASNFLWK